MLSNLESKKLSKTTQKRVSREFSGRFRDVFGTQSGSSLGTSFETASGPPLVHDPHTNLGWSARTNADHYVEQLVRPKSSLSS